MTLDWINNFVLLRRLFAAHLLAFVATGAFAAESMTGTWASSKEGCRDPDDRIIVKPLAIESNAMNCDFAAVSREGNTVTWAGHCFSPEGGRRPDDGEDGMIQARLDKKTLMIEGLGMEAGPLVRCKR
jgi:hypothetical protein